MRRAPGLLLVPLVAAALSNACASGPTASQRLVSVRASGATSEQVVQADSASASTCAPHASHHVVPVARTGATIALVAADGRKLLYAASGDDRALYTVDLATLEMLAVTPLDGEPAELLPLTDGRVLVALRDKNRVVAFEAGDPSSPLTERCSIATYVEPFGLAVSPDGAELGVTAAFDHKLMILDAASLAVTRSASLSREPRGVLFSEDGDSVYVSHAAGGVVSMVSRTHPERGVTSVFARPRPLEPEDASANPKKKPFDPSQELAAAQGFALAEMSMGATDGKPWPPRLFVPMASSDPARFAAGDSFPGVYGGGGGPAVIGAFVAVLDPKAKKPLGADVTALRQGRPEDCVLPRGIATYKNDLVLSCLGSDKLEVLDARSADPISALQAVVNVAPGSSGVAVDAEHDRAFVMSAWKTGITVVDLETKAIRFVALPRRERSSLSSEIARGRELFHVTRDTRMSADGRACASCHPDGRTDGLTWATPDGPRQTISLAGTVDGRSTYGWFGDHPSVPIHVEFTAVRLGGTGLADDDDKSDLRALSAYVGSMKLPTREGALTDADDVQQIERGRAVFNSDAAACAGCHPNGGSDGKRHDVGSGSLAEKRMSFETPSLFGVGASAPYFHDGRYASLFDLVSDPKSKMGHAADLPESDRRALVRYLETLLP